MAGVANLRLKHEFLGTKEDVDGHELRTGIRHVENLATHTAMTVIEDDQGVFQHPMAGGPASLGYLLVKYAYLIC